MRRTSSGLREDVVDPSLTPFVGVVSGLLGAVIGSLLTNRLTRSRERDRLISERRFEIYMKLMDIYNAYFWWFSAELRKEPVPQRVRQNVNDLSWQLSDLLRSADEVDFLEDALEIIMGPSYESSEARYHAMSELVDRVGAQVNPRFAKKMKEIGEANRALFPTGRRSNAPGMTFTAVGLGPYRQPPEDDGC